MGRKHMFIGLMLCLLGLLLFAAPASAGGWVVITLDSLPGPVSAGEGAEIGFMVRQHGVRPVNDVTPVLSAENPATGETIRVEAVQVGEPGHYQAVMTFPAAGTWEWQISAEPFPQRVPFEPITVTAAPAVDTVAAQVEAAPNVQLLSAGTREAMGLAGALLLVAALALALIRQRGRQQAVLPESVQ